MAKPKVQNAKYMVSAGVLVAAAIFSYLYFQTYQPKSLKQVRELKAFQSDQDSLKIPVMNGAKELGNSGTDRNRQITLEINRDPNEIRSFYSNVFLDRGWKVSSKTESRDFLTDIYKKENQTATITISRDTTKPAVVGINIITL